MIRYVLFVAAMLVAAPVAAQTSASLPVTCSPTTGICVTATPVTNPDGSLIGAGGGSGGSIPTGTAGSPNAQVVSVQGVSGGTPQPTTVTNTPTVNLGTISTVSTEATQLAVSAKLPASLGAKTGATSLSVVPASDGFSVVSRGGASLATGQVSIATTSTLLVAARATRQRVTISVGAANTCAFGNTGVTTTTGFPLQPVAGATMTLDTGAALFAACSATTTVSYVELF